VFTLDPLSFAPASEPVTEHPATNKKQQQQTPNPPIIVHFSFSTIVGLSIQPKPP
jgi:hypothetical protein